MTSSHRLYDNTGMSSPAIDLSAFQKALAQLQEAIEFWRGLAPDSALKPHLRSSVIQSFEFTYELSVRMLRRVLIERSAAADLVADLSFNDLLRRAADAGLIADPQLWRDWREMRNATSHAYDETKANQVATGAIRFAEDAAALLGTLETSLAN